MTIRSSQERPGFTILEITLVLGILVVLVAMTIVLSVNAIGRSALQSAENVLVQALRRAQTLAQNNVQDAQWGVYICPGPTVPPECGSLSPSIILFRRGVFGSYSAVTDQVFELNPNIAFTGDLYTAMIGPGFPGTAFKQITGEPVVNGVPTNGTITFTLHGEQRSVTVNTKGLVEH